VELFRKSSLHQNWQLIENDLIELNELLRWYIYPYGLPDEALYNELSLSAILGFKFFKISK